MDRSKAIQLTGVILLWLVSALLGIGFVLMGAAKFSAPWPDMFAGWGFPASASYVIGIVEIVAGVLLLIPKTAPLGALALATVMVGATGTHLVHGESNWSFTLILLCVLVGIAIGRYRLSRG